MLQCLVATNSIDIIARDFNYDILDIFTDHAQMVNKSTYVSGSLIEDYIRRALIQTFFTNLTLQHIYFSVHDAVKIVSNKDSVDFQINP